MISPQYTRPKIHGFKSLLLSLLLLQGCSSYAEKTSAAMEGFRTGDLDLAAREYADSDVTGSEFLSGSESGTALFTAGRWPEAKAAFERAQAAAEDIEARALLSASDLGEGLASWVLNDTAQSYAGEGFERVYVHLYLAQCYLTEGKLEDVLVEVRLANRLLEAEQELYESEYAAGGMGHFISAVAYELMGEFDQALIDYQRMAEKGVGLEIAGPALVRLARQLNRPDLLAESVARFGDVQPPADGAASIVILAGVGLAPYKEERRVGLETPDGLLMVVAPDFVRRGQPVGSLRLALDGGLGSVRTAVVEAVHDVAEKNLDDRIFKIAAKSTLRTVAKRELTKQLEEDHGIGGRILGDLFSAVTERADLRFWQTLPDSWQAARLFVEPGEYGLTLEAGSAGQIDLGRYRLAPGETLFVIARSIENQLFAHTIGGSSTQP